MEKNVFTPEIAEKIKKAVVTSVCACNPPETVLRILKEETSWRKKIKIRFEPQLKREAHKIYVQAIREYVEDAKKR